MSSIRNSEIAKIQDRERKRRERRAKGIRTREEYEKERQERKRKLQKRVLALKKEGLSNAKVAEKLGISKAYVGKLLKEVGGKLVCPYKHYYMYSSPYLII